MGSSSACEHRSPCGERWVIAQDQTRKQEFQSTLPVRGATLAGLLTIPDAYYISIHAPREGSDVGVSSHQVGYILISIHAPREGSDRRFPGHSEGP